MGLSPDNEVDTQILFVHQSYEPTVLKILFSFLFIFELIFLQIYKFCVTTLHSQKFFLFFLSTCQSCSVQNKGTNKLFFVLSVHEIQFSVLKKTKFPSRQEVVYRSVALRCCVLKENFYETSQRI